MLERVILIEVSARLDHTCSQQRNLRFELVVVESPNKVAKLKA